MKKQFIRAAVAGMFLAGAAAYAAPTITSIDTFNTGPQIINGSGTDTNAIRTLENNVTAADPFLPSSIAAADYNGSGMLLVNNGSADNSAVTVSWNLASDFLAAGSTNVGFLFTILQSDGNPTNLSFTLNGVALANFVIPGNTLNTDLTFGIADGLLDNGGLLTMSLTGLDGWDLRLDAIDLVSTAPSTPNNVPEPASAALLGLGLVGMGAMRRRKHAA